MERIEREKKVVKLMIDIYCHHHHGTKRALCPACQELYSYASNRLAHCTFGEDKPTCQYCHIHCYALERRELIKEVMRYAGPRMILHHPVEAIRHLLRTKNKN